MTDTVVYFHRFLNRECLKTSGKMNHPATRQVVTTLYALLLTNLNLEEHCDIFQ